MGTQVAFVHMASEEEAEQWFAHYGIADVPRFSDPEHRIYRAFELHEGSIFELAHPRVWRRWLRTVFRSGASWQGSHWKQLTGMFLIDGDVVLAEMRHRNSAVRPDYLAFVRNGRPEATIAEVKSR